VRIDGIIWLEAIVEKLESKHHVATAEVEEVLGGRPRFRFVERGHRAGENAYAAFGRTGSGRRLLVFFVYKPRTHEALIVSAREPTQRERRLYEKK
jgi:uncharacterized DUF497 family protein